MNLLKKIGCFLLIVVVVNIIVVFVFFRGPLKFAFARSGKNIPVLLYHHILKEDENKLYKENGAVLSYENFYNQMKYLKNNGYNTLTMNDLYEFLYYEKEIPDKSVLITFDDGYLSNYTYAYKIMKNFNLKGSIFLITNMIGEKEEEFNPDKLNMLSWENINKMKDVFKFYSHTHDMHKFESGKPALTSTSIEEVKQDLEKSLTYSLDKLAFSYPFGAHNKEVIEELKKQEIKLAFTVQNGYVNSDSDPYKLNRFVIYPTTKMERFIKILEQR